MIRIGDILIKFLGTAFLLFPFVVFGQLSLDRQVFGNAGFDADLSDGINVLATIGETMVFTLNKDSLFITEGFQQPDAMVLPILEVRIETKILQCPDIKEGEIEVIPEGCLAPYSISLTRVGDTLPFITEDDVDIMGYTFKSLDSGEYIVTIRGATLCTEQRLETLGVEYEDCDVSVYTGITPNGDGKNDFWIIPNIESNQPNSVRIYSRWGTMVWKAENYDNDVNVWDGQSSRNSNLPDGTYYYIIDIPDNSTASGSGWIQLTR